jgi:hypothetical protein
MILVPLLTAFSLSASAFTPTSAYRKIKIEGFEVLISPEVRARPEDEKKAVDFLQDKLRVAAGAIPPQCRPAMRRVRFWVEWEADPNAGATFHQSKDWLSAHGMNPEKERGIEIQNLRHALEWGSSDQPMMILHELSHGYIAVVLGNEYQANKGAYEAARSRGIYDAVPYIHGGTPKAYAMENEFEYFAELSEAYFGKNDYFPYTREDLQAHDPRGFAMIEKAWSKKAACGP